MLDIIVILITLAITYGIGSCIEKRHFKKIQQREIALIKKPIISSLISGIFYRNNLENSFSPCFPPIGISEYAILSILPDKSTSPFSRLNRFTCKSVPFTIIIPCSVSSNISFRSNESTSATPVTRLVFLLFTTNLWFFCTVLSSNSYHNLS